MNADVPQHFCGSVASRALLILANSIASLGMNGIKSRGQEMKTVADDKEC